MQWVETVKEYLNNFNVYWGTVKFGDILEILIIAFLMYHILDWMKTTRAWQLLKGVIVIGVFLIIAKILDMNTIIWLAQNVLSFAVIAMVVVMQPELRQALEVLGKKKFFPTTAFFDSSRKTNELFSEKTINEIVRASVSMAKVKTGALMVIEQKESLKEYERTGIDIDGIVTSQLLINIFEHNTPLHDGAVLIRGNRIVSATCYLPRSDNMNLSKDLGTRHRAGVGISECTDSVTVIVSEETGKISVAYDGQLERGLSDVELHDRLLRVLNNQNTEENTKPKHKWIGRSKAQNEKAEK